MGYFKKLLDSLLGNKIEKYGKDITVRGFTFPSSIYGIPIKLAHKNFKRQGLLKLHGANTKGRTEIVLAEWTINKGHDKVQEILSHEFAHVIYHLYIKNDIFEKIDSNDFKITQLEYWDYISRSLPNYITKYAGTHSAEDFAELIGYGYYIENNLSFPKKMKWNNDIKFKYIIAMNLYKAGLKKYLK